MVILKNMKFLVQRETTDFTVLQHPVLKIQYVQPLLVSPVVTVNISTRPTSPKSYIGQLENV